MKKLLISLIISTFSFSVFSQTIEPITKPATMNLPNSITSGGQTNRGFYETILSYKDGIAHFSEVVEVKDAKAIDLYVNAVKWINQTFENPQKIIQTNDKELGLLTIKPTINQDLSYISFTMDIQVKDGRYKYDIYNMVISYNQRYLPNTPSKTYEEYIKTSNGLWAGGAESDFGDIIRSLKRQMRFIDEW